MGIFSALLSSEDKGHKAVRSPRPRFLTLSFKTPVSQIEEEMVGLYHSIDSLLPQTQGMLIQFIGTQKGEGTTSLAREFARAASSQLGKSILLLETASNHLPEAITPIGLNDNLKAFKIRANRLAALLDTNPDNQLRAKLRDQFDLVLVDSAPAKQSSHGLALARHMDGVVLVVEAEKTRWPLANHMKEKILRSGGKVLGVILNKRRLYIPAAIYRLL